MAEEVAEPKVCEPGGSGLLLPFVSSENDWSKPGRAVGYLMALLWCFLGVSIVADIFMAAIEAVTSKRKEKTLSNGRKIAVKLWNPTVANLTLMALGSSAPEILLSIIELLGNSMYSGELGPGTIVGSAAFNLLVIIAVCVSVVPEGQKRTIAQPTVFYITASFSVFAYLWLILILSIITPNVVDPWEGVLSFLWFPILVVLAYLADIGKIGRKAKDPEMEKLNNLRGSLLSHNEKELNDEDLAALKGAMKDVDTKSRAQQRLKVSNGTALGAAKSKEIPLSELAVGFMSSAYVFSAEDQTVTIEVEKFGASAFTATVEVTYTVIDRTGGASAPEKMLLKAGHVRGKLVAKVPPVIQDPKATPAAAEEGAAEPEKYFWVDILDAVYKKSIVNRAASFAAEEEELADGAIKAKDGTKVIIPHDRHRAKALIKPKEHTESGGGQVRFALAQVSHSPSETEESTVSVMVQRFNGSKGELSCNFYTQADTARAGYDYESRKGVLTFPDGAVVQKIDVKIAKRGAWEGEDKFLIFLTDIDEENPVVVSDSASCSVTIHESGSGHAAAAAIMRKLDKAVNFDAFQEGNSKWREQIRNAFRPVAGDEEDAEEASVSDWAIHFVALPWKVFFAFIPPASYCEGWLSFGIALVFIGVVTAVIGDLASLMGCCMGLPDSITAITVVALGTSLPDTFASKVAAVEDPTADAAIGNVTGSNSVNVFLGLGLPWMIASIFWASAGATTEWKEKYPDLLGDYPNGGFVVMAGDLTFSVIIFTICSLAALSTIMYRRYAFQAELGGPTGVKVNTSVFFVLLWFCYIGLASWKTVDTEAATGLVVIVSIGSFLAVFVGMVIISLIISGINKWHAGANQRAKDNISAALKDYSKKTGGGATGGSYAPPIDMHGVSAPPELVEAVGNLRSHLEGLSSVCTSLELAVKAHQYQVSQTTTKRASGNAQSASE